MENTLLTIKNIHKEFYKNKVLENVDLNIKQGEIRAVIGENGAGKSTLIKIIAGAYKKDKGEIYWQGKKINIKNPASAKKLGISVMYQEYNLLPEMTVAENIYLGREPKKIAKIIIDKNKMIDDTKKILEKLDVKNISPNDKVKKLTVAQAQFVSVAQAISTGAKLIIMDEPTASLTKEEVRKLFNVIAELKKEKIAIIYISHHIEELLEIADKITVLRDGKKIFTKNANLLNKNTIIKAMVGRELTKEFPEKKENKKNDTILEVKNIKKNNVINDVSIEIKSGEILGIAGLVGAGRTELVRCIFAADKANSKKIKIKEKNVNINSPKDSIKHGIALLPEERKTQAIILNASVKENITLSNIKKISGKIFINNNVEKKCVQKLVEKLNIKTTSIENKIKNLSGGNQQKTVIAKWVFTDPKIIIFDEPTRGIDVGAKYEIYKLMLELIDEKKAIVLVSSDLNEILGMCDRVIVMHKGKINAEINRNDKEFNQEDIMKAATGEKYEKIKL